MTLAPRNPLFDEEGICVSAEDWLGKRFSVGDTVMYCIGAGRGQQMAIGDVRFIRVTKNRREYERDPAEYPDAPVELRRTYVGYTPSADRFKSGTARYDMLPRAIVVEEWDTIEVQVLTARTSGYRGQQRVKPAWVNPMNITALPADLTDQSGKVRVSA